MSLKRISIGELQARRIAGATIDLVDVRSPGEFAGGHIPGARNVPLGSAARLVTESRGTRVPLVLICESGGRAARCADMLATAGVAVAEIVEGGTAAWRSAHLPLERTGNARGVISLERQVRIAAGTLVLVGCGLGLFVHPAFYALAGFVGAGLIFAGVTDFCGMGLLLARMPWNQR